ncbi:DUF523 domain-containing protein [Paraburkholderia panacisoli]|uniref:DUF523 domain-containing protein n=1 Tax=Paraburkholderia panacisoli TaxID=2603818 RepID=A0A5B0GUP9_9BURK|nr:DUF523 domain-containing protein [Paraburkholderia panacisoli]
MSDNTGANVTALFIAGAQHALQRAQAEHCRYAPLADGSPSCGSTFIYDGAFSGATHAAAGVTAKPGRAHRPGKPSLCDPPTFARTQIRHADRKNGLDDIETLPRHPRSQ